MAGSESGLNPYSDPSVYGLPENQRKKAMSALQGPLEEVTVSQPRVRASGTPSTPKLEIVNPLNKTGEKVEDYTRVARANLSILKFPFDLEERNIPHVLFKVFETETGTITKSTSATDASLARGINEAVKVGSDFARTANDTLLGIPGKIAGAAANVAGDAGKAVGYDDIVGTLKRNFSNFSLNRNTQQLSLAIALFMPDGLATSYDQDFSDISITSELGTAGFLAQAIASKNGSAEDKDAFVMEAAGSLANKFGFDSQDIRNLLLYTTTGKAINPQLEMLYRSPKLRTFTFDFRLVPRNASEAAQIRNIITQLKYFAAPTIPAGTSGRYFIPPARFEIEFYHHMVPNDYLFRTKQCILESISLDYSPNGYASHYDGSPVETRMQLTFKETTIIDRDAVGQGY